MVHTQSFASIASLLLEKNTNKLSEALLKTYCSEDFTHFVDLINLLFLENVYNINHEYKSNQLKTSSCVLRFSLKYILCAKSVRYTFQKVKRNELLLQNRLAVRDVIHMQKQTSFLIFLKCHTNDEIRVVSKILRGEPPIPRERAIEALAGMCSIRHQYMIRNFCDVDDCQLDFSTLLEDIFDLYPNYRDVAELLRIYECDLPKMLKRGVKVTLGYPVKSYDDDEILIEPLNKIQIHYDSRKRMVKFFHAAQQQLWAFDKNYYYIFQHFISVKKECILDVEVEEYFVNGNERRFIIYPIDVLLFDGIQCINEPLSKRRDILKNIINTTAKSIQSKNGKLKFSLKK